MVFGATCGVSRDRLEVFGAAKLYLVQAIFCAIQLFSSKLLKSAARNQRTDSSKRFGSVQHVSDLSELMKQTRWWNLGSTVGPLNTNWRHGYAKWSFRNFWRFVESIWFDLFEGSKISSGIMEEESFPRISNRSGPHQSWLVEIRQPLFTEYSKIELAPRLLDQSHSNLKSEKF